MSQVTAILEHPAIYRLWQAPFANQKLEPVFRHNNITKVRRVLDVGCGPGTNTPHFANNEYLGIDFNERYIEDARQRYKRAFVVADVTQYSVEPGQCFDFILVNSILHHINKPDTLRVLSHLNTLLTNDGHIHILELVQPGLYAVDVAPSTLYSVRPDPVLRQEVDELVGPGALVLARTNGRN